MTVPNPSQSICHRWCAPSVAASPQCMLEAGYRIFLLHIGISTVALKAATSVAYDTGKFFIQGMGKSSAFRIFPLPSELCLPRRSRSLPCTCLEELSYLLQDR